MQTNKSRRSAETQIAHVYIEYHLSYSVRHMMLFVRRFSVSFGISPLPPSCSNLLEFVLKISDSRVTNVRRLSDFIALNE